MQKNHLVGAIAATTLGLAGIGTTATALAATSAGAAEAAPAVTMSHTAHFSHQWKLNGPNRVTLTFQGHQYNYNVRFSTVKVAHNLELLRGSLRDSYEPQAINLPVSGVIHGNQVTFNVRYPSHGVDAGNQGVRTFQGNIDRHGHVSGNWSETGSENGSGPFSLLYSAR